MYKKVYKGNKYYYAIHIEDINNLMGDLTDIIGTTRKTVFTHHEFDNYVMLYNYMRPNLIVDASEHYGKYLTIYRIDFKDYDKDKFDVLLDMIDNYIFELYDEEEFEDNFIDIYDMRELVDSDKSNTVAFDEFKDTLDFIKQQDEKMNNFCNVLEQLSPGEYCNCFLYDGYENRLLEMLCKAMNLSESKQEDLYYWLYNVEWGTKFEIGDIISEDGTTPDLTTMEKLYNYLIDKGDE